MENAKIDWMQTGAMKFARYISQTMNIPNDIKFEILTAALKEDYLTEHRISTNPQTYEDLGAPL
jgi:hypothetical protein